MARAEAPRPGYRIGARPTSAVRWVTNQMTKQLGALSLGDPISHRLRSVPEALDVLSP